MQRFYPKQYPIGVESKRKPPTIVCLCLLHGSEETSQRGRGTKAILLITSKQAPPLPRRPHRIGMDGRGREVLGAEDGEAPEGEGPVPHTGQERPPLGGTAPVAKTTVSRSFSRVGRVTDRERGYRAQDCFHHS